MNHLTRTIAFTAAMLLTGPSLAATTITYTYDDLNRLTDVSRSDGPTQAYVYDEVSNITTRTGDNPDTDGDGLTDIAEVNLYQTDPARADTDGDGLGDGEEVNLYHTNPTLVDTDGDGYSDRKEILAGTDPLNNLSFPVLADEDIPFLPPLGLALMALLLAAIGGRKTIARTA